MNSQISFPCLFLRVITHSDSQCHYPPYNLLKDPHHQLKVRIRQEYSVLTITCGKFSWEIIVMATTDIEQAPLTLLLQPQSDSSIVII